MQRENVCARRHIQCYVKDISSRSAFKYDIQIQVGQTANLPELLNPETVTGLVVLHAERYEQQYITDARL